MRIYEIRGIQANTAEKLAAQGIKTSADLLEAGRTPAGRAELAAKVGVDPHEILQLVNRADLARVRGIGEVYSNLLEIAGVDTVAELAQRNPVNLHQALVAQVQAGQARRAPTLAQVTDWVNQARQLGRGVEY
jgi:predicted flap endonuclease-1-like 5' DNA nuclease